MTRGSSWAVAALLPLLLIGLRPGAARTQELIPGAIGGGLGMAAGGYVSIAIWTMKARRGEYLYSVEDALGWESTPVLIGGGIGLALGAYDTDRLRRAVITGAAAGFVGTGVGMVLGRNYWEPPEGRWAGGIIGGATGIVLGSLVGMLLPGGEGEDDAGGPAGVPFVISVPLR